MKKSLLLLFCCLTATLANAEKIQIDGLYYNLDSDTQTAELTYYSSSSYNSSYVSGEIVIPEKVTYNGADYSVTSIGDSAFYYCSSLTSVTIPNSVTSIGSSAFSDCSGLTSVTIPNSVTSINRYTFYGCSGLTSVTIPDSVTSIGEAAFYGCSSLTSVTIPKSVSSIGNRAFNGCEALNKVIIEDGVWSLDMGYHTVHYDDYIGEFYGEGKGLFYDCPLEKIYIGRNFSYKDSGFYGYSPFYIFQKSKITEISIGKNVNHIGENAFLGCSGLKRVNISSLEAWYNISFAESDSNPLKYAHHLYLNGTEVTDLVIPDSVTKINDYLFYSSSLKSVTIPNSVTSIGSEAFYGCSSLTNLVIGDSVTSIGKDAFTNCGITSLAVGNSLAEINSDWFGGSATLENLEEVSIGTGMKSIDNGTFARSSKLKMIKCRSTVPPIATPMAFPENVYSQATLYVPEQSLYKYASYECWNRFLNILTFNEGVSLSSYNVKMAGNMVYQLGVYGTENRVSWSSANPDLVYVNDNGLITARGITGSTIVTAEVDGASVDCRVMVDAPYWVPGADEEVIEPTSISIDSFADDYSMLNVSLQPMNASTVLEWTSSDESLASVKNGFVTLWGGSGDVTLSALTENGLKASYSFSVSDGEVTGVDGIEAESDCLNVYDITGRCVLVNGTPDQFNALPAGIYIVNGKKVIMK